MQRTDAVLEPRKPLRDDPRWMLAQRVLASQAFAKAPRLSEFLDFVCRRTITGHSEELNEQTIGENVFERSVGYDPGQDNIVRVQASRLRQRLETYFRDEGAHEELRILMPKGGYVPRFEPAHCPIFSPTHDLIESEKAMVSQKVLPNDAPTLERRDTLAHLKRVQHFLYGTTVALLLVASAGLLYLQQQAPGSSVSLLGRRFLSLPQDPSSSLWAQVFDKTRTTYIVPGDSGLVLYESQADRSVTLAQYLSGEVQTVPQINPASTRDNPNSKTAYRYTSIVDLLVASHLVQLPEALQGHPQIRYSRDLKLDDLKGADAVLIGAKDANPWVELFEGQMNFAFDVNRQAHDSVVTNKSPQAGEEQSYHRYLGDPSQTAYGLIALLPNLNHSGNVLIVEGTTAAGTEAAAEFAFEGDRLNATLKNEMDGLHHVPYFELLLQTSNVGGSARESKVVAFRVHRQ